MVGDGGEPHRARLSHVLILVIRPFRPDQNMWQPRSMGVGWGLLKYAKLELGGRGKHFVCLEVLRDCL